MPNPFRVGDRVRRIGIPDGLYSNMPNGSIWIVSAVPNDRMIRVENDPSQGNNRFINYFELVEREVTQPELPQRVHTFYYVLYSERNSTEVTGVRRAYEESANNFCNGVLQDGGTVHAKKKITVRY